MRSTAVSRGGQLIGGAPGPVVVSGTATEQREQRPCRYVGIGPAGDELLDLLARRRVGHLPVVLTEAAANLDAWVRDYIYAVGRQLAGVLRRHDPKAYRRFDPRCPAGIERCVLVAHSKGGLIGKQLLARHHQATVIQGLVAVNTSFSGSKLALLLPLPAIRAFLPRSPR